MPAKKMRVELYDNNGNRYTITFEGQITRDKALQLFDLIELLGGLPSGTIGWKEDATGISKFERIQNLVRKLFPLVWFSSKDVQQAYEQEFKEPITLSTVSTYLSRMCSRGFLIVDSDLNVKRYRTVAVLSQKTVDLTKENK
jgi:hypothetical protein